MAKIWALLKGTPVRITRREFVVSTGALVAAAALFGSAPFRLRPRARRRKS